MSSHQKLIVKIRRQVCCFILSLGSVYFDSGLMRGGFVGGEVNSGAVLVFKSHAIPQKVSHVMATSTP